MSNPNDRTELTALEYAAIHLRVEHPDIPEWLNEMIRKARRDEFADAYLPKTLPELLRALAEEDAVVGMMDDAANAVTHESLLHGKVLPKGTAMRAALLALAKECGNERR